MSTFFSPVASQKPLGGGDKAQSKKGRAETTIWASVLLVSGVVFLAAAFSLSGSENASDVKPVTTLPTTIPPTSAPVAAPEETTTTTEAPPETTTTTATPVTAATRPTTTTQPRRSNSINTNRSNNNTSTPTTAAPSTTTPPTTADPRPPAKEGKQPLPGTNNPASDALQNVKSGVLNK